MKYKLLPILLVLIWSKMYSQDLIITNSGDSIWGHISYETPVFYKMRNIQGDMRDKYGASEKFFRDDISIVNDNDDQALRHKFGKIKIYRLNSDDMLKKPFYSANDSSISVIASTYKSSTGKTLYEIKDISISHIERIHWRDNPAGLGIAGGACAGMSIGFVIGALASDPIYFSNTSEDAYQGILVGATLGLVAGAVAGGLIQRRVSPKPVQISIKGSQKLWVQSRELLPSYESFTK